MQRQQYWPGALCSIALWHVTGVGTPGPLGIIALDTAARVNVCSGWLAGVRVCGVQQPVVQQRWQMLTYRVEPVFDLRRQAIGKPNTGSTLYVSICQRC